MYLFPLVLLVPLGFAVAGLMGVWPLAIPLALVGMLFAIVLYVRSGREGPTTAEKVRQAEPTGETRPPSSAARGGAVTANERVGQG
jgi:hypothetical protein